MSLKKILTYSILTLTAVGGFFGHIDANINPTELANISIGIDSTYAAAGTAETTTSQSTSQKTVEMYNNLINTINIIFAVLSALITPIILFVGWLMSPDWTSGDIFGLRAPMYQLWVTVSNIVYFIYAVLLIMIALGTMFGDDKFSYKVMLPKLALGILMVPFTWWFVQWTVSIASVVTASVMTIPHETISAGNSAWFTKKSIPEKIIVDNSGTGVVDKTTDKCPDNCISPETFLSKGGGVYGPLVVYGYSIFKFKEIDKLETGIDVAKAAINIIHSSIVSAIMFGVFGILVLALAAMLLVRAIKLWMYAIFAPLFTFRFVAGSNMLGGDDDSFSIKEFIGLAFVPAIVGLTLSFGLIMINAVSGTHKQTQNTNTSTTCNLEGDGCILGTVFGSAENQIIRKIVKVGDNPVEKISETTFEYGGVKFIFKGKAVNPADSNSSANGVLDAVGGMLGTIIIDVIALVFIWMAFMAAKNVSKAVKAAVQPFEAMGTKIGSMARKLPEYTPLPQSLGGNVKNLSRGIQGIESVMDHKSNKDFEASALGQWVRKNSGQNIDASDIAKIESALKNDLSRLPGALAGASKESFESAIIPKILENKEQLTKAKLENKGYDSAVAGRIEEIVKDGKIEGKEKLILQALLSKASTKANITEEDARIAIKDQQTKKDNPQPQATSGNNSPNPINVTINQYSTTDSIAGELKSTGATEDQIREWLNKNTTQDSKLRGTEKEIMEKIKKLNEPPKS